MARIGCFAAVVILIGASLSIAGDDESWVG
jgi:hypothetical protein